MKKFINLKGQTLIELILAMGLAVIIFPALLTGFITSREGKVQQSQRMQAVTLLKESEQAVKSVRSNDWSAIATNGTYHPVLTGSAWALASGSAITNGFTEQIVISSVSRNSSGDVVTSGGVVDPSTKQVAITISWSSPIASSVTSTLFLTRFTNLTHTDTTAAQFNTGTLTNTQITTDIDGEIKLGNNNKGKWCSPSFSNISINLPDGPPVAVSATASAVSITIPNDIFVATAPNTTNSVKLAHVILAADTDTPIATLEGTFTLDSAKYSDVSYVPTGIDLDNDFKTNDVKYYKAPSGNLYALLATNLPSKEVIAVQIKAGSNLSYQDPVNKIYKYWTFFNTRLYQGNSASTPNQDQAPHGYGAVKLAVLGTRAYTISGGYLYVIDLSNIDSKTPSSGLDMIGCRVQLDGYDCKPGNPAEDKKYGAGQTGANWSDVGGAAHNDCSDGGNIELYADNDIYPVQVGSSTYVYIAVGAGTNPEFNIANVTSVPTGSSSPTISNSSCGRSTGGNAGWKRVGTYDFNSRSGTEEAANSVFAKSDGTRAYITSNGGADSKQYYILNTTNKGAPTFLSGSPSTGPSSGFYNGAAPAPTADKELYPRRAMTVQNGVRAVLVGKDGVSNSNDAEEYQVLDNANEATPTYCGGLNFDSGFNDLTSASELDGDNYVYMVANATGNALKVIQGGPDNAIYVPSGTYESSTFDPQSIDGLTSNRAFNSFSGTVSASLQATIKMQVASALPVNGVCPTSSSAYTFVGPNGDPSAYFTPAGASISGTIAFGSYNPAYENPGRCFRYKADFSTTDQMQTPILYNLILNYSP